MESHEVLRIMQEGSSEETKLHINHIREGVKQERNEEGKRVMRLSWRS